MPAENKTRPTRLINKTTEMAPMLATAMMERTQRTNWPATAPQIIVIKFTMTAMVGKRLCQIKVPRLAAYFSPTRRPP